MNTILHTPALLRTALFVNAGFSIVTGVVLLAGARPLAPVLGIPGWLLAVVGVGVAGFGLAVGWGARRAIRLTGKLALVADVVWVAATLALLPLAFASLTPAGRWAVVVVGVIVADLAVAEWLGLRREMSHDR